jgi:predicted transposase YdaD
MVRIKLDLLRQMPAYATEAQVEQALRYVDAYLEETDPGAVQRTLAALNQPEYREAGMLIEYVKNEGRAEGKAEGMRAKALEDARKMREHGIAWDIVTDVTGLKPEDLEAAPTVR